MISEIYLACGIMVVGEVSANTCGRSVISVREFAACVSEFCSGPGCGLRARPSKHVHDLLANRCPLKRVQAAVDRFLSVINVLNTSPGTSARQPNQPTPTSRLRDPDSRNGMEIPRRKAPWVQVSTIIITFKELG